MGVHCLKIKKPFPKVEVKAGKSVQNYAQIFKINLGRGFINEPTFIKDEQGWLAGDLVHKALKMPS
jgi:hypothetical protein